MLIMVAACQPPLAVPGTSTEQPIVVTPGQDTTLGPVYWVVGCDSALNAIVGVEMTEGDPTQFALSVKRDVTVMTRPDQCGRTVTGGIIMVRLTSSTPPDGVRKISYTVTYDTQVGLRQSRHTRYLKAGGG